MEKEELPFSNSCNCIYVKGLSSVYISIRQNVVQKRCCLNTNDLVNFEERICEKEGGYVSPTFPPCPPPLD